jgi:hypothetical protein
MSELYDLVDQYARFGNHRTGTETDRATVAWLCEVLRDKGADVRRHPYQFPMFLGTATANGPFEALSLMPLYYAATGTISTKSPLVAPINFDRYHGRDGIERSLAAIVSEAKSQGASLAVVPTLCENGGLSAINRGPHETVDFPICLAPGRELDRLKNVSEIHYEAGTVTGRSENISAYFPSPTETSAPLVVTTPVSGWFQCAGERGSGLAIALSIARKLSQTVPVMLILTNSHEIGFFGGKTWMETFDQRIRGVLHIGACVADLGAYAETASGFRANSVRAIANLDDDGFQDVKACLGAVGIDAVRPERPSDPGCWIGESELWATRDVPMVSIAGNSKNFHTPEDTLEASSNPHLLALMEGQIMKCAEVLNQAALRS